MNIFKICTVAMLPLAIAGCVSTKAKTSSPRIDGIATLTAAQTKALQEGVKGRLKDPDSARFGELAAGNMKDGSIHVCGLVNSKNSYGGYTGMAPYSANINGTEVSQINGPTGGDEMISSML